MTVVVDPACPTCRPTLLTTLSRIFPAAIVKTVPADSKEGKALVKQLGASALPLYALDKTVEQATNFPQAQRMLMQVKDRYVVRPEFAQPTVRLDRPRIPQHLDVFVSSLLATTPAVESRLIQLFSHTTSKDLTFSLHFIAQEAAKEPDNAPAAPEKTLRAASLRELQSVTPGPLFAAGGEQELKESLRQLCLFQHASMGDFFTYLTCRNQDLSNPKRAEQCLVTGKAIQACLAGPEGEQLLREDARMIRSLGITAGPVLLWENRYGPFSFDEADSLEHLINGQSP